MGLRSKKPAEMRSFAALVKAADQATSPRPPISQASAHSTLVHKL